MLPRSKDVVNEIICHKSDSKYSKHGAYIINEWHSERFRPTPTGKLRYIGYHFVIKFDGTIEEGRALQWYGQHTAGKNYNSIGVCFQGDITTDINDDQMNSLGKLVMDLSNTYPINKVSQHSEYEPKKPHCAGMSELQLEYANSLI